MNNRSSQSGNVIFLILIAVVLFAALSFAVTMGGRAGSRDAGTETTQIKAARLSQDSVGLERAIIRLRITMKTADDAISFENQTLGGYINPACSVDDCKVFRPDGGQSLYTLPDPDWLDQTQSAQPDFGQWIFTGSTCVPGVGGGHTDCDTNPNNYELVAYVPWLSRATCIQVNRKLGIGIADADPPQVTGDAWSASPEFTGTYGSGYALLDAGGILFGKMEGCFQGNGTPPAGSYHYYRVLFPR
jgi:hypothetical protein